MGDYARVHFLGGYSGGVWWRTVQRERAIQSCLTFTTVPKHVLHTPQGRRILVSKGFSLNVVCMKKKQISPIPPKYSLLAGLIWCSERVPVEAITSLLPVLQSSLANEGRVFLILLIDISLY